MCSASEAETEVVTVLNGLLYKQTEVAGLERSGIFLALCKQRLTGS